MEKFQSEAYRVDLAGTNLQYSPKVTGIVSAMLDEYLVYTYDQFLLRVRKNHHVLAEHCFHYLCEKHKTNNVQ